MHVYPLTKQRLTQSSKQISNDLSPTSSMLNDPNGSQGSCTLICITSIVSSQDAFVTSLLAHPFLLLSELPINEPCLRFNGLFGSSHLSSHICHGWMPAWRQKPVDLDWSVTCSGWSGLICDLQRWSRLICDLQLWTRLSCGCDLWLRGLLCWIEKRCASR